MTFKFSILGVVAGIFIYKLLSPKQSLNILL